MNRAIRILGPLLALLGLLVAPAQASTLRIIPMTAPAGHTATITVRDDHGTTITLATAPRRIISLAPNVTEILFALGLGPRVVAVSSYSDYPAAAKRLPMVINYTSVNTEKILTLKPDLLIAAAIVPQTIVAKLRSLRLAVLVTDPHDVAGILADVRLVGVATGTTSAATRVVTRLERRIDRVRTLVGHAAARPRVFYELDPKALYTGGRGSFVDNVIALAGGINVAGTIANPYPQLSVEQLIAANPQYIILGDSNYGTTAASVAERPGFAGISAVKTHHVYPFDDDLISRPGPRIVDGLEQLARLIHPGLLLH